MVSCGWASMVYMDKLNPILLLPFNLGICSLYVLKSHSSLIFQDRESRVVCKFVTAT